MGGEKCRHLLQQYPLQALLHGRQLRFEHVRGDELRERLPVADGGGGWGCSLLLARAALFLVLLLLSPPASLLGSLLSPPSSPGSAHPVEAKCGEQQADCAAKQQAMQRRGLIVQCASGGGAGRAGGFTPQRYLGRAGMMVEERREVSARVCAKCASPRRRVEEDHRSSNAVAVWLLG